MTNVSLPIKNPSLATKSSNTSGIGFSKPEWVICGGQMPVGVRVLASKDLNYAELEVQFTYQDIWDGLFPVASVVTSQHITLHTSMRTFVIIDGPDYSTCLKHLFEKWSPDETKQPAIDSGQKQLES